MTLVLSATIDLKTLGMTLGRYALSGACCVSICSDHFPFRLFGLLGFETDRWSLHVERVVHEL